MTGALRPLWGIAFAALLALSLITTTVDAVASTPSPAGGGSMFFDEGFVERVHNLPHPRPLGRLGVSWE